MGYKVFVVAGDNAALNDLPAAVGGEVEIVMLQSSNEALWELQQNAPAAIIADLDLPGFSGLDLAELVPNFAPDTWIMLCARQPQGKLDAPNVHRLLLGEQTAQQVAGALNELLAQPVPERAPPPPEPEPVPPPAPEPAPARAKPAPPPAPEPARSTSTTRTSAAPAPARASGPPPVSARPVTPTRAAGPPPVSARPAPRTGPPQAVSPRPEPAPPRQSAPPPRQSAPPPAPAAPPPDKAPKKRHGGPLVVTAEILAPIRAKLKDLGMQLGAQATVLADRWGVPLVEEGRTTLPLPPFLPLLATSFSTMIDYTRQLHADEGSGLYMHEGTRYDIYIFDVGRQFLLVMIFDKQVASSKLGSVWIYAKRAVRELAEILEGE